MKDKRSTMAKLVDFYLRHFNYHKRYDYEENVRQLEQVKLNGEKEYHLPKRFKKNVSSFTYANMKTYVFNGKTKSNNLIIYLYGGGYVSRPVKHQLKMIKKIIKKTDAKVIMPLYPLLPFHTFGECYDMLIELYDMVLENNVDKNIILLGDSAGGGLSCGLCEYFIQHNIRMPDRVFLMSPAMDLSLTNPEIEEYQKRDPMSWIPLVKAWAKFWSGTEDNLTNYLVSPLYGEVKGFPPTNIYIATNDLLFPDGKLFADKLKENGVDVYVTIGENLNHVWPAHPIPEAKKAINEITKAINELKTSEVKV
ncbi:MAG: alpha/beta hydrolase [Erysipelotrichales bacterium]|nr:alpha/beta hydrolase [Erysipelotrichales bacterium]